MPRHITLELSRSEARVLLVRTSGAEIAVEQAFCVPVPLAEEGGSPEAFEKAVVAALAEHGMTRLPVVGVVGRSDVELRLLQLPPAPDDELPEMVRFQAAQEFPNLASDAVLDFLPQEGPDDGPRRVLAVALKPGAAERFARICGAAKLSLARLVLHPAAAGSLAIRRRPELQAGWFLLVDILDGQAELTALRHGRVAFSRHVLLPDAPPDSAEFAEALSAEVRRTRAAAGNQEGASLPEPLVVFGQADRWPVLAEQFGSLASSAPEWIDPFTATTVSAPAAHLEPDRRARFAALVGAAADEADDRAPAVDFLHPTRRPEPAGRRNAYMLAGLVAACIVLAAMLLSWLDTRRLRASIRDIQQESASLGNQVEAAEKTIRTAEEIGNWVDAEVVWLDELRWLSENFTPAEDAVLTKLMAGAADQALMRLEGLARNESEAGRLDRSLNDATHRLIGHGKSENPTEGRYRIQFQSTVHIERPQ